MLTNKYALLKACAGLYLGGIRIKRLTRKLNRALRRRSLSSPRAVRLSLALECAKNKFSAKEERAIHLFLLLSSQQ